MDVYDDNVFVFPGSAGQWDEVSQTPVTHRTHWEDFPNSDIRPRYNRTVSSDRRKRILERDLHQCQQCGSEDELEVDHIIPVAYGGSDEDDNLQILCRDCNKEKGPKPWSRRRANQEGLAAQARVYAPGAFPEHRSTQEHHETEASTASPQPTYLDAA